MAKRKKAAPAAAPVVAAAPAEKPGSFQLPLGALPFGVKMVQAPQFSPELANALRNARENVDGRFLIVVFTADDPKDDPHRVHMHYAQGRGWNPDWFLRAYRNFVSKGLEVTPETMATVKPEPTDGAGEVVVNKGE
jgi:hypothetical protein